MPGHADYFADQAGRSNPEFWHRFGNRPRFDGQRVLDFGSGHGAMSLEMARAGAIVLGVDLDEERIDWAKANLLHEPVAGSLEFQTADVTQMNLHDEFDLIISKDSFEHIEDLRSVLVALRDAMKPDGRIWAGFSPLYYSPWGDHGRTGMRLPWAHALPRPLVYAAASRHHGHPIARLDDLGLNGMTPREFRRYVEDVGLRFESIAYNRGDKALLKTLDRLRRYDLLERYATVGIYTVLAKDDAQQSGS
jgi:SAM-dependent methyltransferase